MSSAFIRRLAFFPIMLSLLTPVFPVAAQGIFDLPPIQGGAAGAATPVAPIAPTDLATLDYTVSPDLRVANQQAFIEGLRAMSPEVADQMGDQDLIALMATALEPYGFRVDNLGDAFTAWLMINHSLVTADEAEPTPAQINGSRDRFAALLLSMPDMTTLSDADKQSAAEQFLLQALLNQGVIDSLKEVQPAGLPAARQQIADASIQMGLDLNLLQMTENGLAPK